MARLIGRFPAIADRFAAGRLSVRVLVELREVLTEENHAAVLARAEGMSQEEAQILAVEYRPRPIPTDIVRAFRIPIPIASTPAVTAAPAPAGAAVQPPVSAETARPPTPLEIVKPLTPDLRRLNVTVSAEFMAELEQVRTALSHQIPDGNFEDVVREAFKLVLERDRKRKSLTDRPRAQPPTRGDNDRYVPAEVKRAVWKRDQGRCSWPMGDGKTCGSKRRLEFDHDLEVALGGKPVIGNVRLLCKAHNLMKAERHLGKRLMERFVKNRLSNATDPP